jgi:hypothetical protein
LEGIRLAQGNAEERQRKDLRNQRLCIVSNKAGGVDYEYQARPSEDEQEEGDEWRGRSAGEGAAWGALAQGQQIQREPSIPRNNLTRIRVDRKGNMLSTF